MPGAGATGESPEWSPPPPAASVVGGGSSSRTVACKAAADEAATLCSNRRGGRAAAAASVVEGGILWPAVPEFPIERAGASFGDTVEPASLSEQEDQADSSLSLSTASVGLGFDQAGSSESVDQASSPADSASVDRASIDQASSSESDWDCETAANWSATTIIHGDCATGSLGEGHTTRMGERLGSVGLGSSSRAADSDVDSDVDAVERRPVPPGVAKPTGPMADSTPGAYTAHYCPHQVAGPDQVQGDEWDMLLGALERRAARLAAAVDAAAVAVWTSEPAVVHRPLAAASEPRSPDRAPDPVEWSVGAQAVREAEWETRGVQHQPGGGGAGDAKWCKLEAERVGSSGLLHQLGVAVAAQVGRAVRATARVFGRASRPRSAVCRCRRGGLLCMPAIYLHVCRSTCPYI